MAQLQPLFSHFSWWSKPCAPSNLPLVSSLPLRSNTEWTHFLFSETILQTLEVSTTCPISFSCFPSGSAGKEPTCNAAQQTWVQSLGWEDSLEEMATSIFLPGKAQEERNLASYSPCGPCKESDRMEHAHMPSYYQENACFPFCLFSLTIFLTHFIYLVSFDLTHEQKRGTQCMFLKN